MTDGTHEVAVGAVKAAPGIGVALAPFFGVYLPVIVQVVTVVYMLVLTVIAIAKYRHTK